MSPSFKAACHKYFLLGNIGTPNHCTLPSSWTISKLSIPPLSGNSNWLDLAILRLHQAQDEYWNSMSIVAKMSIIWSSRFLNQSATENPRPCICFHLEISWQNSLVLPLCKFGSPKLCSFVSCLLPVFNIFPIAYSPTLDPSYAMPYSWNSHPRFKWHGFTSQSSIL